MNIAPRTPVPPSSRARRMLRHAAATSIATISLAACSSGAADEPTPAGASAPSVSPTASPSTALVEATATVGPGTGSSFFGGTVPTVPVTFTMPKGWETGEVFVSKSDADPVFGLAFFDVANIYADGCYWELVDPPPGPTVDDLVAAYANVPGAGDTARDVTVDGYSGKQIEFTVPEYDEDECVEGKFAIINEDHSSVRNSPSLWAQTPGQTNQIRILDVDGTRLVVLAGYPPNISAKDRTDLDEILSSVKIG